MAATTASTIIDFLVICTTVHPRWISAGWPKCKTFSRAQFSKQMTCLENRHDMLILNNANEKRKTGLLLVDGWRFVAQNSPKSRWPLFCLLQQNQWSHDHCFRAAKWLAQIGRELKEDAMVNLQLTLSHITSLSQPTYKFTVLGKAFINSRRTNLVQFV